jgi:sulfite reductase beta subunit-like hemoprotein
MIRVRVPGGVSTPEQYLAVDQLADKYANGTIKLTTRQAYQLHGVLKKNLKTTIQGTLRVNVRRWRSFRLNGLFRGLQKDAQ